MTLHEIINKVHQTTGLTLKDSHAAVKTALDAITDSLRHGDTVRLTGFGTFSKKATKARVGRNPASGETIKIPASHRVAFRSGKVLTHAVKVKQKETKRSAKKK